jgi:general secretion pathway protein C
MVDYPLKKLRFINIIIALLALISALLLTRTIITISFSKKETHTNKILSEQKQDFALKTTENIMRYAPIVEQNPFGSPMQFNPIVREKERISNQGSPTELLLFGTVTGPEKLSYAIFTDKSKPSPVRQELFTLGEEVYNYGTLTNIKKDFVELTQGAKTYTIPIVETESLHTKKLNTNYTSQSSSQFAKKINEKQYVLDQRKVQQALSNPEQVLSDARLYPNMKNGKHEGFRGLYEELGLKNRDVLLNINGLNLTSPQAAMQAMSALKGMNTVNLDIIRSGKKMTLNYQVR